MLLTILLSTALAVVLSVLFTPIVRALALRCNLVDLPDNKRKVHKDPIPRVGGVALAAAYFGSLLVTASFMGYQQARLSVSFAAVKSIALPALIIFLIGLADDIFNLKPWQKFMVQIVAAAMVVFAGVQIQGIGAFHVHPILGIAASIIWLVGCTNAVNLIDGLDGLAAGIAFLATTTVFIASLITGNVGLTIASAPLAGALLGFLVFNFNPASIFLGDSGSLLLGFLLGCFSIMWSGGSAVPLHMLAPAMALTVPLLDTTLAITRRFLSAQPLFKADRSHIHHRLLARGLSHRGTVLLLYVTAAIAGSLALCLLFARDLWEGVVIAAFGGAVMLGVRELGYAEFDALRRVISRRGIRREISSELAIQTFKTSLDESATADECWRVIQDGCSEFGFHSARMQLAGRKFYSHDQLRAQELWAMRVPLHNFDWIELSQSSSPSSRSAMLVIFANTIRRALTDKRFQSSTGEDQSPGFSPSRYNSAASVAN